jgi:hypothetical protein
VRNLVSRSEKNMIGVYGDRELLGRQNGRRVLLSEQPRNLHPSCTIVRVEVFTAVTMKNAVFWDFAPCRCGVNRRIGGTYRLHLLGRRKNPRSHLLTLVPGSRILSSTLKMEAIRVSETSVCTISTQRQIPQDAFLHIILSWKLN